MPVAGTRQSLLRTPWFLVSGGALVLLMAGSVAGIAWITGDPGAPVATHAAPPELSLPAPLQAPPAIDPVPRDPLARLSPAQDPGPVDPARVRRRHGAVELERSRDAREGHAAEAGTPALAKLVPSRARFLVTRAIEQQAPQLAECFGGRSPPTAVASARPSRGQARLAARGVSRRSMPADGGVLRLEIEPQANELWIYDAKVEERGTATDAELACARRVLRGLALEFPGATPGPRGPMLYPLP